jgi:hypothetical protein
MTHQRQLEAEFQQIEGEYAKALHQYMHERYGMGSKELTMLEIKHRLWSLKLDIIDAGVRYERFGETTSIQQSVQGTRS